MLSETIKESANNPVREARYAAKSFGAKSESGEAARDAGHTFTEKAAAAGHQVQNLINTTSDHISEFSEKLTSEVRNNPVSASIVAAGMGFILGLIVRR